MVTASIMSYWDFENSQISALDTLLASRVSISFSTFKLITYLRIILMNCTCDEPSDETTLTQNIIIIPQTHVHTHIQAWATPLPLDVCVCVCECVCVRACISFRYIFLTLILVNNVATTPYVILKVSSPFYECGLTFIPAYITEKCGVKLLIHSQTSTIASLKFGDE